MNRQDFLKQVSKEIHFIFDRKSIEKELNEHLDDSITDLMEEGLSREEAESQCGTSACFQANRTADVAGLCLPITFRLDFSHCGHWCLPESDRFANEDDDRRNRRRFSGIWIGRAYRGAYHRRGIDGNASYVL